MKISRKRYWILHGLLLMLIVISVHTDHLSSKFAFGYPEGIRLLLECLVFASAVYIIGSVFNNWFKKIIYGLFFYILARFATLLVFAQLPFDIIINTPHTKGAISYIFIDNWRPNILYYECLMTLFLIDIIASFIDGFKNKSA